MENESTVNLVLESDNAGNSCYFPSLFTIRIDCDYMDCKGNPKKEYLHIFMHEYGHLIQDTTTLFGAFEFANFNDRIVEVLEIIKKKGQKEAFPILNNIDLDKSTFAFFKSMREATHPSESWNANVDWDFVEFIDPSDVIVTHNGIPHKYLRTQARFKCKKSGSEYTHAIGVSELKENHSMAIQNIYSLNDENYVYNNGDDFKYFVIKHILGKEFINTTNQVVLLVCQWSLNSINPGQRFHQIVKSIKEKYSNKLPSASELNTFLKDLYIKEFDAISFQNDLCQSFKELRDIYKKVGDEPFALVYDWYYKSVTKNLSYAIDFTSNFPLQTALCNVKEDITQLFTQYPIYLYFNSKTHETFTINSEETQESKYIFFIYAMQMLLTFLCNNLLKEVKCPLYGMCKKEYKSSECLNKPWLKGQKYPYCPFGLAAKYLEIELFDV